MVRIICEYINSFYYFTGSHIGVKFNFKLSAAAGRDLLFRKESSSAASTGFYSFNSQGTVARVSEFKSMFD